MATKPTKLRSLDNQKNRVTVFEDESNSDLKTERSQQPMLVPLTIQMIRREFDLPSDEELFDDFGCTLKSNLGNQQNQAKQNGAGKLVNNLKSQVRYQGRLYITDQHMCFNSNFMGITYKNKLQFSEIKHIQKNKIMGIWDSGILVQVENKESKQILKYQYASFENRDIAFKRVIALWESTVPKEIYKCNKSVISSNGPVTEGEDVDIDRPCSNPITQKASQSQFKGLSYKQPSKQLRSDCEQDQKDAHESFDYASQKSTKTIEKNEDFSIRTSSGDKIGSTIIPPAENDYLSQSNAGFRESQVLDKTIQNQQTPPGSEEMKNFSPKSRKVKSQQVPTISDEELENLLNQDEQYLQTYNEKNGWKVLQKTILDISIDQFNDQFIADGAEYGLPKFYENVVMYTEVTHQPWKKNQMTVNYVIPLVGVPFINQSRAVATLNIHQRLSNKIVMEIDTKTIDAPYSDTFSCKECQIVIGDDSRCIFLQVFKIHFVKSTMFRSKITQRAEQGMVESNEKWHQRAKKDGLFERKLGVKLMKRSSIVQQLQEQVRVQSFESPNDENILNMTQMISEDQSVAPPSLKRGSPPGFRFDVSQDSFMPKYLHMILSFLVVFLMSMSIYKDYKLGMVTDLISQQNTVLIQHQENFEFMNKQLIMLNSELLNLKKANDSPGS